MSRWTCTGMCSWALQRSWKPMLPSQILGVPCVHHSLKPSWFNSQLWWAQHIRKMLSADCCPHKRISVFRIQKPKAPFPYPECTLHILCNGLKPLWEPNVGPIERCLHQWHSCWPIQITIVDNLPYSGKYLSYNVARSTRSYKLCLTSWNFAPSCNNTVKSLKISMVLSFHLAVQPLLLPEFDICYFLWCFVLERCDCTEIQGEYDDEADTQFS